MRKLILIPSQAGYSASLGNEVLTAALSGGPSRSRLDFIGAVANVSVSWNLPPTSFNYLQAFYRTATLSGSEPFLIDLILDEFTPVEYEAKFVPGSYNIVGVRGNETTVQAELEARPSVVNPLNDESMLVIFEEYGEDASNLLASLDYLMNTHWPNLL